MSTPIETGCIVNAIPTLGRTITVTAVPANSSVAIDLLVNDEAQNIGFHFNPRFDEKVIVLNNCVNGVWQEEQVAMKGSFMWSQSSFAVFKIDVQTAEIKCSWNGLNLKECTFQHRVDQQTYIGLQLTGLNVVQLDIQDDTEFPGLQPTLLLLKSMPFRGKNLRLVATPMLEMTAIDFRANDSDNNIAFHFNPRYDEKVIERNSLVDGKWQKAERSMSVPFTWELNKQYEFNIYVAEEFYSCVWDGVEVCTFKHRFPIGESIGLNVWGMCIKSIQVQ